MVSTGQEGDENEKKTRIKKFNEAPRQLQKLQSNMIIHVKVQYVSTSWIKSNNYSLLALFWSPLTLEGEYLAL